MFCVYLLILVAVSDGQDNFFLAVKNNEHTCVTNSSYGLTWITDYIDNNSKYVSEFIPLPRKRNFDCDISKDANTKTNFVKKPWMLKNSLLDNANNEIILDRRWEDLDIHLTDGYQNSATWQYMDVVLANLSSNFDIPFSVRIESDVNIFLCDGSVLFISDCYQFILDKLENGDRKSAIKTCSYTNGCSKTHFQNTYLVNKNVWSHFSLKKSGSYFTLRNQNQNEIILQLNDNTIRVTHMLISSVATRGLWKFHELDYIYTNDETNEIQMGPTIDVEENFVCVSMFVSMCNSCQLKLTLKSDNVFIQEETFSQQKSNQQSKWFEIKFLTDNISFNKSNLFVSTIGQHREERFWAIDKVRLCQRNEFRKISFPRAASCQLISDKNRLISSIPDVSDGTNNCPENTIGTFCIPCQRIFRTCDKVQICKHLYLPASRTVSGCWCSRELTNWPHCNKTVDMPYDVHIEWTFNNDMILEWKQNVSELEIDKFLIAVYPSHNGNGGRFNGTVLLDKKITYDYKVNASFFLPSVQYTVEITAYSVYGKRSAVRTVLSPPEKPFLQFTPKLDCSDVTITLELVRPNRTDNITVLITDTSGNLYAHPKLKMNEPEILQHLSISRSIYTLKNFNQNYVIVIGNGSVESRNQPLAPNTFYNITLLLSNTVNNQTSYNIYFLSCSTLSSRLSLALLCFIPVVIINTAIVILVHCKRQNVRNFFNNGPLASHGFRQSGADNSSGALLNNVTKYYDINYYMEPTFPSRPISPSKFQQYVKESETNGELNRQFEAVNSTKKLYDEVQGNSFWEYIDMVYTDGFTVPKAYIASEVPSHSKIEHFWRTIYEANVKLVILVNIQNEKYWPDINEKFEYNNITLQLASEKALPGYKLRKFILTCDNEEKHVDQIDFNHNSQPKFELFFEKMAQYQLDAKSPILIHSRNSIRAVGFVLLCDMSLRMVTKDGIIDVLKIFKRLSELNANLVDDKKLFILAHTVISKCAVCQKNHEPLYQELE